jgi:hypothetical protein
VIRAAHLGAGGGAGEGRAQGIDIEEIIATVHAWRAPMMSAIAGLQL